MTFFEWAQMRLNVHGANLDRDGDFGVLSYRALVAFQKACGLPVTRMLDRATVDALSQDPSGNMAPIETPKQSMPVWLEEMTRRMNLHEVRDNKALSGWLRIGKYLGNPKELPWCGDAVETCFAKTLPDEPLPSNPFWAQGWRNFGIDLGEPIVGAVGVIKWSSRAGHVGFVINWNAKKICLRGGNQANAINDRWFPRKKFIAYCHPASVPVEEYARIRAGDVSANLRSTR